MNLNFIFLNSKFTNAFQVIESVFCEAIPVSWN